MEPSLGIDNLSIDASRPLQSHNPQHGIATPKYLSSSDRQTAVNNVDRQSGYASPKSAPELQLISGISLILLPYTQHNASGNVSLNPRPSCLPIAYDGRPQHLYFLPALAGPRLAKNGHRMPEAERPGINPRVVGWDYSGLWTGNSVKST